MVHIKNNVICMYTFFFNLFSTSRYIFVSACIILTFERREILDQSTFDTCSTHNFSNQNKLQQKCHQVGFFKKYYVLGFFENLAVFLFWFKTGNKKERHTANIYSGKWDTRKKCKSYKYLLSILQCKNVDITVNHCKSVFTFFHCNLSSGTM